MEVSLKEHFDSLREADKVAVQAALVAAEKAVDAALVSAERAVNKAEENQRGINKTQNEFRGALKDQAATLLPTKEAEVKFEAAQKEIDAIKRLVYIGMGAILMLQFVLQYLN